MGAYDKERFRQIMVDAELHRQLSLARQPGESLGDVIRRLIGEGREPGTKKGRSIDELIALGRIARRAWERKLTTGEVKVVGRR